MFYSVSKKCLYFLSFKQQVRILQVTKIQRVHSFCGLKTEAAHNTQLCHNAASSPNFIIMLSLTSSSDCNNFTPLSAQKLKDFLAAVLASLLSNDCIFSCVHSCFSFFFLVFYLNTTETRKHTLLFQRTVYFFHVHVGVAPHPTPPALNCSGFGFIMVHVNVFVSAYIMFFFWFFCTSEHC